MKHLFKKAICSMVILIFLVPVLGLTKTNDTDIMPNIYINGINIGGMSRTVALSKLKNNFDPILKKSNILLKYNQHLWRLSYSNIQATYNYVKAVDKAYALTKVYNAKISTLVEKSAVATVEVTTNSSITTPGAVTTPSSITTPAAITTPVIIKVPRQNIKMELTFDWKAINNYLNNLSTTINIAPVDATLKTSGNKIIITDGKNGLKLDIVTNYKSIVQMLTSGKSSTLNLITKLDTPKYNKENLLATRDKLGQYTTSFNSKDVSRVMNISLAANNCNNFIIMPNEIFSLNKTIGPRLEKLGFKLAHVIVANRLVDGIGGGVCQVSSTLYNAVLLANLKIIERTHHSIPSTYVSLGRDATISGDYIDFKFQNNTKYPIFIRNEVIGNKLSFTIYGKNDFPNRKVNIITKVLSRIKPIIKFINDPTLKKGTVVVDKKGYSAWVVQSSREVIENGKVLYKEPLFTDKYPLINSIKRIGTKN